MPGDPAEQEADRCDLNQRLAGLRFALIILGQPAVANQLGETALHDPTAWLDAEAARAGRSHHNLQVPASALPQAPRDVQRLSPSNSKGTKPQMRPLRAPNPASASASSALASWAADGSQPPRCRRLSFVARWRPRSQPMDPYLDNHSVLW
jgi:hypothetical protein